MLLYSDQGSCTFPYQSTVLDIRDVEPGCICFRAGFTPTEWYHLYPKCFGIGCKRLSFISDCICSVRFRMPGLSWVKIQMCFIHEKCFIKTTQGCDMEITLLIFLCMLDDNTCDRRHYVFRLSVCSYVHPSHSHEHSITRMPKIKIHLDLRVVDKGSRLL